MNKNELDFSINVKDKNGEEFRVALVTEENYGDAYSRCSRVGSFGAVGVGKYLRYFCMCGEGSFAVYEEKDLTFL